MDIPGQLGALRAVLADARARCAAGSLHEQADPDSLRLALEDLEVVAAGLSGVEADMDRRLSEEATREDRWFRELAGVIPEGVFKLTDDGSMVYANDVLLELFGLTRADLAAGINLGDFLVEGEFQRVWQAMAELSEGREPKASRYRARHPDGSIVILEALGATIQDAAGKMVGFWGVARDVTADHRAEKRVEARANLRLALATVSELGQAMQLVLDAALQMEGVDSGCVYAVGPAGERTFEPIAPRGLSDEFVRAVADRPTDPRHGLRAGTLPKDRGLSINREAILRSSDPSSREEGLHSLVIIPMWDGAHPAAVLVVASHKEDEIPPQTRVELEEMVGQAASAIARIKAEEARQRAVDTFEAMFRTVPLAMYIMDLDRRIVMWNPAATQTFGWSESEILGEPAPFVPEDKREEFERLVDQAFKGGPLRGVEVERRRKDGSRIFARISSAILHDGEGRPIGMLSTAEDVTEKRLAEQSQQRLSRLESLGVLAGGIAHDFNNVLMGITGNINLARSEADPDIRNELLDEAQDAAVKAVELTAQLLTFAKGGAPVKEVVNLSAPR